VLTGFVPTIGDSQIEQESDPGVYISSKIVSGIPLRLTPDTILTDITGRGLKYIFRMTPPSSIYGKIHVQFAKEIGAKNVAIIGEDSLF